MMSLLCGFIIYFILVPFTLFNKLNEYLKINKQKNNTMEQRHKSKNKTITKFKKKDINN